MDQKKPPINQSRLCISCGRDTPNESRLFCSGCGNRSSVDERPPKEPTDQPEPPIYFDAPSL